MSLTLQRLCELALELPGTEAAESWGAPNVKVGKKAMFYWNPKWDAPVFKMDFETRDFYLEADPETFFTTDHHRNWPCILAHKDRIDEDWIRGNLRQVWLKQAPKSLLKVHEADIRSR
ncbi:MmcQ/YjbR family DNA-binding protein [Asticcacaulis sp. 201]|uniref:MmcQ/YjbR family DNA-binding protein n=1 Tax=Asticcacaulis sp. 201 TaxID=3028787 RepID=UPI0029161F0D|nr:MmcQ/YjbR family DNA-binding protein [Asticcacaulis sp. 201]MDV6329663.1 MmcQ/YjbR family DNA-binding protein [Asticcacaulis sp. 201]